MRINVSYLAILLLIGGCGLRPDDKQSIEEPSDYQSDSTFDTFKDSFSNDTGHSASSIAIVFASDMSDTIAGMCYYYNDRTYADYNYIKINSKYWKDYSLLQREQLIYHELGHCVLYKDHNDARNKTTGCPVSIMNSYMFSLYESTNCYQKYHSNYISDLIK